MKKSSKGILGIKKDPKNQILFSSDHRFGDDWPSSDSDDSDYQPQSSSVDTPNVVKYRKKRKKSSVVTAHPSDPVSAPCDSANVDSWGYCIPHLVLRKIFRYVVESTGALPFLCRAQRVCRLWRDCAGDSRLWKKVDLSYGWIKATDRTLQLLCDTRFTQLTDINLSNWKSLTVNGLKLLADTCPQLKSINLSHCRVSSQGVMYVINKCTNLSTVDLMSYGSTDVVSAKMIVGIINKCSAKLQSLNLSRNPPKGYNIVLKALSTSCPNLVCLDLSQNPNIPIPLSFDIEQLQHGCPKLRILRLVNTAIEPARVSNRARSESPGFPELEELSLGTSNTGISIHAYHDVLRRLVKTSEKLKLLDLRGWSQLNCDDLQHLCATDLAHLYISGCSFSKNEGIEVIALKWQHSLIELDVSWNVHTEAALDAAVKRLTCNSATSKLEVLDMTGTRVSLDSVQTLLQGCPHLQKLNLSSCRSLPRGMKREYLGQSLSQLRNNINSIGKSNGSQ